MRVFIRNAVVAVATPLVLALATIAFAEHAMAQPGQIAIEPRFGEVRYGAPGTMGFIYNPNIFSRDPAWESALRYAGEFSGFRIAAGIGYANNSGDVDFRGTGFSASGNSGGVCFDGYVDKAVMLHVPSGLFLSAGGMGAFCSGLDVSKINPTNDLRHDTNIGSYALVGGRVSLTKNWNVQGGISQNWFGMGNTTIYGEYGAAFSDIDIKVPGFDGANETKTGSFWGIGVAVGVPLWGAGTVQTIDAAAMELYLGYRRIDMGSVDAHLGTIVPVDIKTDVVTGGVRLRARF
jgi:hypothetical protein